MLPVEGLAVEQPWTLGPVVIHTAASLTVRLSGEASEGVLGDTARDGGLARRLIAETPSACVAEVEAVDVDAALDRLVTALDILRVFQQCRFGTSRTTTFGLPGQVYRSSIRYVRVGPGGGAGFRHRGDVLGWTFTAEAARLWYEPNHFRWLAENVGTADLALGPNKALLGVQLLSQAILEHRPQFKLLSLVMALETMLLDREGSSQVLRLCRRAAYLTCGVAEQSLCGRDRDSCCCLTLDPARDNGRRALGRVRGLAEIDTRWRCSEWLRYLRWYDLRSAIVHGDATAIDEEEVSRAQYRIVHYALEPLLSWLISNPVDPLGDLDAALDALPPPPDWQHEVPDPATYDARAFVIPPQL